MLKVGITGGIGSGKSVVCNIFNSMGIPVYDSDFHAKKLYNTDSILKQQMIDIFGDEIYQNDLIDKKKLAEILFSDSDKLNQVNKIVPEAVLRDFNQWVKESNAPYVIRESAIIFDIGINTQFDYIIAVSAPYNLRLERSIRRNNSDEQTIKLRMDKQLDPSIVNKKADFVIENDDVIPLLPQILKIDSFLRNQ